MVLNDQECLLPTRPISVMRLLLPDPNYQVAESECYTNSRCSRPMCGVAAGLSRPSKHLIRLAFTMRSTPHNVGHHESRFPSLGIIPTAPNIDSLRDSQIRESLTRCWLLKEEQHRWVQRLRSDGLI